MTQVKRLVVCGLEVDHAIHAEFCKKVVNAFMKLFSASGFENFGKTLQLHLRTLDFYNARFQNAFTINNHRYRKQYQTLTVMFC